MYTTAVLPIRLIKSEGIKFSLLVLKEFYTSWNYKIKYTKAEIPGSIKHPIEREKRRNPVTLNYILDR